MCVYVCVADLMASVDKDRAGKLEYQEFLEVRGPCACTYCVRAQSRTFVWVCNGGMRGCRGGAMYVCVCVWLIWWLLWTRTALGSWSTQNV